MFTHDKFLENQSVDLNDVLIQTTPVITPFTTFLLNKQVKATAPHVSWITESINETSAVTMPEGGDAPDFVEDEMEMLDNYLEIFGATASVSNTAQASSAVGINDLLAREIANKTKAIKMRMEDKLINGSKGYDPATKTYTTAGILEQIHEDNKVTADKFNPDVFEDVLGKLYEAGTNYNMTCFLPANLKRLINGFDPVHFMARDKFLGFDVETYVTVFGEVNFVLTERLKDKLFIVNKDYVELAVLIPFHATPQPVSGSKRSVYLETQVGVKLLNPKAAVSFEIV